ncbi:MAG: hypothetical protein KDK76_03755 [Chlamydiia bacterium]|nr:hypothetical protein [Chlamydiia bacterium]
MATALQSDSNRRYKPRSLEVNYLKYGFLSPEQIQNRLRIDATHITYLKDKIVSEIRRSNLFELGQEDGRISLLFDHLIRRLGNKEVIVDSASKGLRNQTDRGISYHLYEDFWYSPLKDGTTDCIEGFNDRLALLLRYHIKSIQKEFAETLRQEGRKIVQNIDLNICDSSYLQYSLLKPFSMLMSKRGDTLLGIYTALLQIEWLEHDRYQLMHYQKAMNPALTKPPSKYDAVFANERPSLTPHKRLKENLTYKLELQKQVIDLFDRTYFFEQGHQEDTPHLQELFTSFFVEMRGEELLINEAANRLVKRLSNHTDVYKEELTDSVYEHGVGLGGLGGYKTYTVKKPREEFLRELQQTIEQNYGLKRYFINMLNRKGKKVAEGLRVTDRDFPYLRLPDKITQNYIPEIFEFVNPMTSQGLKYAFPRCQEKLQEIFINLLMIAWLEEDSKELKAHLGLTSSPSKPFSEVPPSFLSQERGYALRPTRPDGACALHALLGELQEGEYAYRGPENPKQLLAQKIQEHFENQNTKSAIIEILLGYLNAQDDLSAQMFFESPEGEGIKQGFLELKNQFQQEIQTLKEQEGEMWIQEIDTIRERLLEEARQSPHYVGLADPVILETLQADKLKLLDLIFPQNQDFLNLLPPNRREQVIAKKLQQHEKSDQWSTDESVYIIDRLYPHYLAVMTQEEFFLNTQEIVLAAHLFQKKAQVFHNYGEAATELIHPEMEGEPIIIYHEGNHFSRCTPHTEEEAVIVRDPQKKLEAREKNRDVFTYLQAKRCADYQRRKDILLLKKYQSICKEELAQVAVSGGVSFVAGNPAPFTIQVIRSLVNIKGFELDPLGDSKELQALKLVSNSAFMHLLGGDMYQVGTALAVDLVALTVEKENMSKKEIFAKNVGSGLLKGVATLDREKFLKQACLGILSELGRNIAPEETDLDEWEDRLFRALLTNVDVQEGFVDFIVKDLYKKPSDPKPVEGVDPDKPLTPVEDTSDPKPDRFHLLDAPPGNVGLRYEVTKEKETTSSGGYNWIYLITLYHDGHPPKEIGKFKSKSKAEGVANMLQSFAAQVDTQNQTSYSLQNLYEKLGLSPEQLPPTLHFNQMYFEMDTGKSTVRLYLNGEKILETKDASYAVAFLRQAGIQQINQNNALINNYKDTLNKIAPPFIEGPSQHLAKPIDNNDGHYHHLSYVDAQGKVHSLGKYEKGADAKFIADGWGAFQTTSLDQETMMFDAQQKLILQGVPIENIPQRPTLIVPSFKGKDSNKNHGKIQQAQLSNNKTVQNYLQTLEGLAKEPLNPQGLSPQDLSTYRADLNPEIKDPKEHGFWFKAVRKPGQKWNEFMNWLDEKGVNVNVQVSTSVPLYKTKSSTSSPSTLPPYGADVPSTSQTITQQPRQGGWEQVQAYQEQKIFQMNMDYQSPSQSSSAPLDYSWMATQGATSNLQLPPTDLSSLGRAPFSDSPSTSHLEGQQMQLAGFAPIIPAGSDPAQKLLVNDFTKSMPKGVAKVAGAILTLMLPDMSDIEGAECPKAHFKTVFDNVLKKYDQVVEIQNPNSFPSRVGEFAGEMAAFGWVGKVVRVAEGVSVFGMACEGGLIGGIAAEAHGTNHIAGVSFGFAGGAGAAKFTQFLFRTQSPSPLIDRVFAQPGGYCNQIRAIEGLQRQAYRSGAASNEVAILNFSRREISPLKSMSFSKGSSPEWFAGAKPRIDQLRGIHHGKRFYKAVVKEFAPQNLSEMEIRQVLHYSGFNTYPRPNGLPSNVVVEFADKNGGMVYRLAGTTNEENILVRVCPGLRKENPVTAIINGSEKNGRWSQETPYVVQRKGKDYLRKDGSWANKPSALTHIRLEEYKFMGWE